MKLIAVVALIALFACGAFAAQPLVNNNNNNNNNNNKVVKAQPMSPMVVQGPFTSAQGAREQLMNALVAAAARKGRGADLCNLCISFFNTALQLILNIIVQQGISGKCGDVCGLLPKALEADICDILCEIVGIDEFSKILQMADPDPLAICMDLTVCPVLPNGNAVITALTVSPTTAVVGSSFTINLVYQVLNETGTGMVAVQVVPPSSTYDGQPFGTSSITINQMPGYYQGGFSFNAKPAESEPFNAGTYQVVALVCEGSCGGTHKNEKIYSQQMATFTLTARGSDSPSPTPSGGGGVPGMSPSYST